MRRSWLIVLTLPLVFGCSKGPEDSAPAGKAPAAPSDSKGVMTCGTPQSGDCPLQAWMKANLVSPLQSGDGERLARGFEKLKSLAPDGYAAWTKAAEEGESSARQKDMSGVRQACKACHDSHREAYRRDWRTRPI